MIVFSEIYAHGSKYVRALHGGLGLLRIVHMGHEGPVQLEKAIYLTTSELEAGCVISQPPEPIGDHKELEESRYHI